MKMLNVHPKLPFLCLLVLMFPSTYASASKLPRLGFGRRNLWNDMKDKSSVNVNVEVYNYTQTLDHFNYRPDSYTTFQQRYLLVSQFWGGAKTSAPILAFLGAEESINKDVGGFIFSLAQKFNALLIFIEHRYYGQSTPFGSVENAFRNATTLGYFTSAQALADYAEVLVSLKKNISAEGSPVIVLGGSYGGMLAAWFRLKYPHIAAGALASSAPLLYFQDLTPQGAYFAVATNVFKEASKTCYKDIKDSWPAIDKLASQPKGLSLLSNLFKTCKPIKSPDDLKSGLQSLYTYAAQYDAPPDYQVNTICNAIDGASKSNSPLLSRVAAGVAIASSNAGQPCYDLEGNGTYEDVGWNWQTCTDLVIAMGVDHGNTMFPISPFSLQSYTKSCRESFGITVTPRPHWIVTEFGGHDIKAVLKKFGSNIIFSNGLRDPYSSGGVLENLSDTIVAIKAKEGSHCLDLSFPSKDDPKWLSSMRAAEIEVIKSWIAEYNAIKVTTL